MRRFFNIALISTTAVLAPGKDVGWIHYKYSGVVSYPPIFKQLDCNVRTKFVGQIVNGKLIVLKSLDTEDWPLQKVLSDYLQGAFSEEAKFSRTSEPGESVFELRWITFSSGATSPTGLSLWRKAIKK